MAGFIIGLLVGGFIGVMYMALIQGGSEHDYNEIKNKYINDERELHLKDTVCNECKFLKTVHWSDGSISFKCNITGENKSSLLHSTFDDECEYFKQK